VRVPLLFLIAPLIACKEKLPIEVGGLDFDYGFLLTYPERGPPLRVSGVFGVSDGGDVTFGEPPAVVLEEGEDRFVFVALQRDQLHPSFDGARAHEIGAIIEPPPEGFSVEGAGREDPYAKTSVPAESQLYTGELGAALRPVEEAEFDLFGEVTLRIPVEPEYCRIPGQTAPAPFGAAAQVLPPLVRIRGIENAFYLDEDHAVVATRAYVYVIERGGTFTSTLSPSMWSIFSDPKYGVYDGVFDLAIGPTDPDGTIPMVAVGGDQFEDSDLYRRVWPLRLNGTSILADGPSSKSAGEKDLSATFTTDGRAWIGEEEGRVLIREPGSTEFVLTYELMHRSDIPDNIYEIRPIDAGGYSMIAGLKNHLYLFGSSGWEYQYVMRSGLLSPEPLRFASLLALEDAGAGDFWAVGDRGQIARKRGDDEWRLLSEVGEDLVYPPRFLPCASSDDPSGGQLGFNRVITAIGDAGDWVLMGYEQCNALVVVRRSDQCVSLLAPNDEEVEFSLGFVTSIDRLGQRILIGYSDGALYETVLPSAP
jgi:hypothetical protein